MIGLLNSFLGQLYDILIGSIDGGHLGLFFLLGLIVEIVVFLLDDVDGEVVVVVEEPLALALLPPARNLGAMSMR